MPRITRPQSLPPCKRGCTGWCGRCCPGNGSGRRSCCCGWRIRSYATSGRAAPTRDAAPPAVKAGWSHHLKRVVVVLGRQKGEIHSEMNPDTVNGSRGAPIAVPVGLAAAATPEISAGLVPLEKTPLETGPKSPGWGEPDFGSKAGLSRITVHSIPSRTAPKMAVALATTPWETAWTSLGTALRTTGGPRWASAGPAADTVPGFGRPRKPRLRDGQRRTMEQRSFARHQGQVGHCSRQIQLESRLDPAEAMCLLGSGTGGSPVPNWTSRANRCSTATRRARYSS